MERKRKTEAIDAALEWRRSGRRVALATVVRTWGSAPVPVGSQLAVDDTGAFEGSVSGGCIEGEVITQAMTIMRGEHSRVLRFSVADETAWEVGLSCGGEIEVLVEALPAPDDREHGTLTTELESRRSAGQSFGLITRLTDGAQSLVSASERRGDLQLDEDTLQEIRRHLRARRSARLGEQLFLRVYAPPLRLILIGAVHVSQALAAMARIAGFDTIVVDPRTAFATAERFPDTELHTDWPDAALEALAIDESTAVVTLTHDPKLDDPALRVALESQAFYIGSLGSRKTHASRLRRLGESGISDRAVARIHAPIGLPIGGRRPAEIAVSILAEIIAVLNDGPGQNTEGAGSDSGSSKIEAS